MAPGVALEEPSSGVKTTDSVLRLCVKTVASDPTNPEKNAGPSTKNVTIMGDLGHFSKMCRQNPDNQYSDRTEVKHIDTEEQSPDCPQSEYTTPYYLTNDQAKASVKCLKTTAKTHHIHNRDTEHTRLLWIAQSQGFQVFQPDCEVDKGAGYNMLPTHKAQQLFGQE